MQWPWPFSIPLKAWCTMKMKDTEREAIHKFELLNSDLQKKGYEVIVEIKTELRKVDKC